MGEIVFNEKKYVLEFSVINVFNKDGEQIAAIKDDTGEITIIVCGHNVVDFRITYDIFNRYHLAEDTVFVRELIKYSDIIIDRYIEHILPLYEDYILPVAKDAESLVSLLNK